MYGMDLNPVKSCPLRMEGSLTELTHDSMDLVHTDLPAGLVQPAMRDGRRRNGRNIAYVGRNRDTAEATAQLQEDLAAVSVYTFCHLPACLDKIDRLVQRVRYSGWILFLHNLVKESDSGDDQPRPAFGALHIIVDPALIPASVGVGKTERSHRSHCETVLQSDASHFYR